MPGVPVEAIKRGDDIVCQSLDGTETWIRVTEFDEDTVVGTRGIPKVPGQRINKEKLESLSFPREAILRYGRK